MSKQMLIGFVLACAMTACSADEVEQGLGTAIAHQHTDDYHRFTFDEAVKRLVEKGRDGGLTTNDLEAIQRLKRAAVDEADALAQKQPEIPRELRLIELDAYVLMNGKWPEVQKIKLALALVAGMGIVPARVSEPPHEHHVKVMRHLVWRAYQDHHLKPPQSASERVVWKNIFETYPLDRHLGVEEFVNRMLQRHRGSWVLTRVFSSTWNLSDEQVQKMIGEHLVTWVWNPNSLRRITEKYIARSGFGSYRIHNLTFNLLMEVENYGAAAGWANRHLSDVHAEQAERARVTQLKRRGYYSVVELPDGTIARIFPLNNSAL